MLKSDAADPADRFPPAQKAELELDRRRFLAAAACAGALAALGEWIGSGVETALPAPIELGVAECDGLAAGEARALALPDGREALVARLRSGEVVAFDRRCPHLGCPVVWAAELERFECPCHRAAFDGATGKVLFGPPRRGLAAAAIRPGIESGASRRTSDGRNA